MEELLKRLRQPSTIKGLCALAGVAGIAIAPDQAELIITAILAVYGIVQTVRDERK